MTAPGAPPRTALGRVLDRYGFLLAGWLVLMCFIVFHEPPTRYNNYTYLADAFAHGHVWIENWPGQRIDAVEYNGKRYIIEGPVPALLMLPAAAAFGMAANQRLHCILLAAMGAALLWRLLGVLGSRGWSRAILFGFFIFGTSYYWCAMYGDVWFFAHVAAVTFTFAALLELTTARRAWLVALFGVLAAGSRFTLVLALPIYAVYLLLEATPRARLRTLLSFAAPVAVGAVAYVWYALARWGVPYDIGYSLWYHWDPVGRKAGSPFRLEYLPSQLYSFVQMGPMWYPAYPWIIPTPRGLAITITSPALLYAFVARTPRRLVVMLWAATIALAVPSLLYYVNGFIQFGMRHALDFEPFMIALMALGARRGLPVWAGVLAAYSIAVGLWGVWFWRTFFRP